MPGNRVSTFPLAAKVVVTVTTKLAIPKGHRASDVVGVGGNARLARGDEGGWHVEMGGMVDAGRRGVTLILITFYEAVSDLCQVLPTPRSTV